MAMKLHIGMNLQKNKLKTIINEIKNNLQRQLMNGDKKTG